MRLGFRRKSGFIIGQRPPHRRTIIRNQFSFSDNPVFERLGRPPRELVAAETARQLGKQQITVLLDCGDEHQKAAEQSRPSVVELRIDHLAGGFCPKNRYHWVYEEPDLLENRSLVPIDVLMRELAPSESHDGDQRNFDPAIGGRNARQHPRNLLCVCEREDHLINKLVPADGA
jgi:hypothetical protein